MDAILLIIALFTGFAESSVNQYNNALIFYVLWICFKSVLIMDKEPCKFAVNKRQNTNYPILPVKSFAYGESEVKLFAC